MERIKRSFIKFLVFGFAIGVAVIGWIWPNWLDELQAYCYYSYYDTGYAPPFDVNGDCRVGLEEAVFALQTLVGIRTEIVLSAPAGVEKTGQTICYDDSGAATLCSETGQDGDIRAGIAWTNPRFSDKGDGTVKDNLTSLIWLKDASAIGVRTWADAFAQIANLNSGTDFSAADYAAGTYDDWRLPNRKELESLLGFEYQDPALSDSSGILQWSEGNAFSAVNSDYYWTSTSRVDEVIGRAWTVHFNFGDVNLYDKDSTRYVWPVRSDNESGTTSTTTTTTTTTTSTVETTVVW